MPWHLQEVAKNKFYVVDADGRRYSNKPLGKTRATRQLRALYANTRDAENHTSKQMEGGSQPKYEKVAAMLAKAAKGIGDFYPSRIENPSDNLLFEVNEMYKDYGGPPQDPNVVIKKRRKQPKKAGGEVMSDEAELRRKVREALYKRAEQLRHEGMGLSGGELGQYLQGLLSILPAAEGGAMHKRKSKPKRKAPESAEVVLLNAGGAAPKKAKAKRKPTKHSLAVKHVMAQHPHMSLPEASRYVKLHGLAA